MEDVGNDRRRTAVESAGAWRREGWIPAFAGMTTIRGWCGRRHGGIRPPPLDPRIRGDDDHPRLARPTSWRNTAATAGFAPSRGWRSWRYGWIPAFAGM